MHDANPKAVKAELDKIHREERMKCINQDMARIKERQEAVQAEISAAQATQNAVQVQKLQRELETLSAQQVALVTEQNEIIRKQKRAERFLVKSERLSGDYGDDLTDSSNFASGNSSPLNPQETADIDFTRVALCAANFRSSTAQKLMQETLFDEGLRIAQQYGMADFAEELKEMKSSKIPNDNGGDSDDSEQSDTGSESDKKRKRSGEDNIESEINGKRPKESLSPTNAVTQNGNGVKAEPVEPSVGFDPLENGSSHSNSSEGSTGEVESIMVKQESGSLSNHNSLMFEIKSEPVQNGD